VKKFILIALGVIVLAAIAFSILRSRRTAEATVTTATVGRVDLTALVDCSGTIQPQRKVDVSANVMGTVTRLAVSEGQTVAVGDFLLEIDPTEYRSAVRALEAAVNTARAEVKLATASLEKAESDLERSESLFAQGINAEEEVIAARTDRRVKAAQQEAARQRLRQQQANLAKAQHDLGKVTIAAPMAGVIVRLNVEEGENAIMGTLNNPGTVLLTIADLATMEAWVEVDETEVVELALGQAAEVEIDAYPDRVFDGRVTEIGNSPLLTSTGASQEAVDFEVKITLDETAPGLRPGLSCKASVTVAERADAVAVPLEAVTVRVWPLRAKDVRRYNGRRADRQQAALAELGFAIPEADSSDVAGEETEGVFLVRDRFVKFVPVELGITGAEHFEILDGVTAGETIVSGPFRILRELKDGSRVDIDNDDDGGDGS
jgi:HlyD family secretion protein